MGTAIQAWTPSSMLGSSLGGRRGAWVLACGVRHYGHMMHWGSKSGLLPDGKRSWVLEGRGSNTTNLVHWALESPKVCKQVQPCSGSIRIRGLDLAVSKRSEARFIWRRQIASGSPHLPLPHKCLIARLIPRIAGGVWQRVSKPDSGADSNRVWRSFWVSRNVETWTE